MCTVLFEPSKHLWWAWGWPLLPTCWGFSFALEGGVFFLVGSNILLSMFVQQQVALLEFSQEKMSTHPYIPPSCLQIDYILFSWRFRSSIPSAKTRLGAACGSDHEVLIEKFRLKLEKVGKTTRSFRYDLNQVPYDYTMEVTNRFKELDLIECLKNYWWGFVSLYRRR